MKSIILHIYDWLSHKRGMALAIGLLLIVLSVLSISKMEYKENITDFLPQDEKTQRYSKVYNELGGQDKIAILFSVDTTTFSGERRDYIIGAIEEFEAVWEEVDSTSVIEELQSGADDYDIFETFDFINSNIPYFLTKSDYDRIDSLLLTPEILNKSLIKAKESLLFPSASIITQSLKSDPLTLFSPVYGRLNNLNTNDNVDIIDNHIFLQGGSVGALFMTSPFGEAETKQNSLLLDMIEESISLVKSEYEEIEISPIGGPVIAVSNAAQIKKDSILSVSIALLCIILILLYSYRNLWNILLIVVSITCGVLFALGFISLFKSSISIIVLGIGSVIIGIAVNYPLHFMDHLQSQPNIRRALKEIISPLIIGNLTTVCAFLALYLMKAEALHDFGLFGAMVLVFTILFVVIFLPIISKPPKRCIRGEGELMENLSGGKRLDYAFFTIVVFSIFFSFYASDIEFDTDMGNINYMSEKQRGDMQLMLSAGSAKSDAVTLFLVSEGDNLESCLQHNDVVERILNAEGLEISSIRDFIPSKQMQQERLQMWEDFKERYPSLFEELVAAGVKQGFSAKAFAQFGSHLEREYKVVDEEFFKPLYTIIGQSHIIERVGDCKLIDYIYVPESRVGEVKGGINNSNDATIFAFDPSDVESQIVNLLSDEFDAIGFVCGVIVFIFLWLSYGSLELTLLAFLPLAISWIWILGIMQLLGLQFNIVNVILATFIFGQGDDYTIFMTEGLIYEYTYGKKILNSYKRSIMNSAAIMLVGIGVLVIAGHPAMRSLGEVTIIGMFTVVLMSCIIPPFFYKWLTLKGEVRRVYPFTIKRVLYSLFSFISFLLIILIVTPCTQLYFLIGKNSEKKKLTYHKFLQRLSKFISYNIPGVKVTLNNCAEEKFDKPAIVICNHQSHLDVMFLMMLTPKIVILTNDWVWKNPLYGTLIHNAEFYPVSDGMDQNSKRLKDLVKRGYSIVVFPEGTRSADCSILRFHRGAFSLAQELEVDVLPIVVHGIGDILPKEEFMLREGSIHIEILKRVPYNSPEMGSEIKEITKNYRRLYKKEYSRICDELENAEYYKEFVRHQFIYKGADIERECKGQLSKKNIAVAMQRYTQPVVIKNSGIGAFAMLMALSNKHLTIYSHEENQDKKEILKYCNALPENLVVLDTLSDIEFKECKVLQP